MQPATLVTTRNETASIRSFLFRTAQPLDHTAGQFIEMTLPHDQPDERGDWRQFTISSSPGESHLAITVNFANARSSFKRALSNLQVGDQVSVSQPLGDFVLPLQDTIPLIWVAGGIGITPFRSISQALVDYPEKREILLFHSVRSPQEAIFEDIFQAAGIKRQLIITGQQSQNRLEAASLILEIQKQPDALIYISGPELMVASLTAGLTQLGVDRQCIITDAFLGYR
jgi:glycine betaine catabolism B